MLQVQEQFEQADYDGELDELLAPWLGSTKSGTAARRIVDDDLQVSLCGRALDGSGVGWLSDFV